MFDGTFDAIEDGTTVDFGAGVTTGGYAWLHVSSITGTAVMPIRRESSADGVTFASEGTITLSMGRPCADVGGRGEPVYPVGSGVDRWRPAIGACCSGI